MLRPRAWIVLLTGGLVSALQAAAPPARPSPQQGRSGEPASKAVHELQVIAGR